MEQTFGDKLKQARTNRGLKQSELAKHLGVTNTTISNWEKNVSKPDLDMLSYICGILSVKASYFLSPILPDDEISIPELEIIKKYRSLDDSGRTHIEYELDRELKRSGQLRQSQSENDALRLQLSREQTYNRLLSYYGRIAAAGKSYGFEDMICGTIEVPLTDENQHADFAIGVSGDSMEPDFTGEDIVYVQKTTHLDKDEIGIFQKDNCIYIKKVGEGVLLSINPNYGPIPGNDVKVLGRVLGKIEENYKIIK